MVMYFYINYVFLIQVSPSCSVAISLRFDITHKVNNLKIFDVAGFSDIRMFRVRNTLKN